MRIVVFNPDGSVAEEQDVADPTPQELDAVIDAQFVALRGLFNHENRLRALIRGVRATSTATQRGILDNQGVEPAREDMTLQQFKAAIKALL